MEDDTDAKRPATLPESLLPYDQWMEEAMRGAVLRAIAHVAAEGLPGKHHFYVTFRTDFPGVVVPQRLLAKYPEEMTVVLQHQYDGLRVDFGAKSFSVSLSFGGIPAALTVPVQAISAFADPHVQFGLRFQVARPAAVPLAPEAQAPAVHSPVAVQADEETTPDKPQVVSLDAFRRRRD